MTGQLESRIEEAKDVLTVHSALHSVNDPPENDNYILIFFENFTVPIVGRYESDKDGNGAFYGGDDDIPLVSENLFVKYWMELPELPEEL